MLLGVICMTCQSLLSEKIKKNISKWHLLRFLPSMLYHIKAIATHDDRLYILKLWKKSSTLIIIRWQKKWYCIYPKYWDTLTLVLLNKLRCHAFFKFQPIRLLDPECWYKFTYMYLMVTVQIQISWLLQKPTDLDLHCLQRQDISGFRVGLGLTPYHTCP